MARHFVDWHAKFMDVNKNVNTAKVFLEWAGYSAISGALERKTWIALPGGSICYPNQFIFIIAPSGVSRKSSGTRPAYNVLSELPDIGFLSTQFSAAALIDQLQAIGTKKTFHWAEKTFNHSAAYLFTSEASVSLKDIEGSNIELLTDLWDGGSYSGWTNTVGWGRGTVSRGHIKIFNPCLNILGCSTPDWLVKALGGRHAMDGGFTSRCLFVVHNGGVDQILDWVEHGDPEQDAITHQKLVEDLKEINQLSGPYQPDAGYRESYNALNREVTQWLLDNPTAPMRGYFSRKLWHVMKMSQVVAASQGDSMVLTEHHFQSALKRINKIEPAMLTAFIRDGNNPDAKAIHMVWEFIRKRSSMTFTKAELIQVLINDVTEKQILMAIRLLTETKKVVAVVQPNLIYYKVLDRGAIDKIPNEPMKNP